MKFSFAHIPLILFQAVKSINILTPIIIEIIIEFNTALNMLLLRWKRLPIKLIIVKIVSMIININVIVPKIKLIVETKTIKPLAPEVSYLSLTLFPENRETFIIPQAIKTIEIITSAEIITSNASPLNIFVQFITGPKKARVGIPAAKHTAPKPCEIAILGVIEEEIFVFGNLINMKGVQTPPIDNENKIRIYLLFKNVMSSTFLLKFIINACDANDIPLNSIAAEYSR